MPISLTSARGQAAFELAIAAPIFLALAALGLESIYLYNFQHRLHVALLQAARAGIVYHNQPLAIKRHFGYALAKANIQSAPWQIRILSPRHSDFSLLSSTTKHIVQGSLAAIDNDYQFLATAQRTEIKAANILELELYYAYRPWHPLLRLAPTMLVKNTKHPSHLDSSFLLHRDIRLPMQSHPMLWPDLADQSVVFYDTAVIWKPPQQSSHESNAATLDNYKIPTAARNSAEGNPTEALIPFLEKPNDSSTMPPMNTPEHNYCEPIQH